MSGAAERGGILREKVGSVPVGDELTRVGILGESMDRIRRGGSGVAWSGDACVALAGEERRSREQDEGDAQHKASPRGL